MRTVPRFVALCLGLSIAVAGWRLGSAGADADAGFMIRPHVEVSDATREQLELVRWAVGRFEIAGLSVRSVRIEFHDDPSGCGQHLGSAKGDRVDVCTVLVNAMTRRALLHEMSHVWLNQHATAPIRSRFLDLRGLPSWNSSTDPWDQRGCEQAAEIMAWFLGERILTPQIPNDDAEGLAEAYQLLTGRSLPG
jgi:hypothetical protein